MRDPRNEGEARQAIKFGGSMSPNRLLTQHYRPRPARRVNFLRRIVRAVVRVFT